MQLNPKLVASIQKQLMKVVEGTGFGNVTIYMADNRVTTVTGRETDLLNCRVTVSGCL